MEKESGTLQHMATTGEEGGVGEMRKERRSREARGSMQDAKREGVRRARAKIMQSYREARRDEGGIQESCMRPYARP